VRDKRYPNRRPIQFDGSTKEGSGPDPGIGTKTLKLIDWSRDLFQRERGDFQAYKARPVNLVDILDRIKKQPSIIPTRLLCGGHEIKRSKEADKSGFYRL